MYKLDLEKAEEPEIKLPSTNWIIEKAGEFQKIIYFCFIDHTKAFDCVDHNKQWNILQEMGIPDHLTCPLKNMYEGQERTVRTVAIIFFHSEGCLFTLLIVSFIVQMLLSLIRSHLFTFAFISITLGGGS